MQVKELLFIQDQPQAHWVGDGFLVQSIFSYHEHAQLTNPFLLLDYGAPILFTPSTQPRGVSEHPHRGFETVTLVYQGEVEHKDNKGNYGKIRPGDVQWMTAGGGVMHSEMHSSEFTQQGGVFEVAQLWVNLPAKYKMSSAKYQDIKAQNIPIFYFPADSGSLRIIAGQYHNLRGPAVTFSPINLFDGLLNVHCTISLELPHNFTLLIFLIEGQMLINHTHMLAARQLAIFAHKGSEVVLQANTACKFLVLSGQPLNEPIAGYGPFVMNTQQELQQAFMDYHTNKF